MKRTVRNGLAIAGMAGGIWFLGSAVASADQGADAANNVDQSSSSSSEGSGSGVNGAGNVNGSSSSATNVQVTSVDTDVNGGDGGANIAVVNTGVVGGGGGGGMSAPLAATTQSAPPAAPATNVSVNTGDVAVHQSADGGDVSGSGNVHVSGNNGDQTATAVNNVHQTADSSSDGNGHGFDVNLAGNANFSSAEATNIAITDIETDVDGGDGGLNIAAINTGILGGHSPCPWWGDCDVDVHTGDVKVVQSADGGDVWGSGNVKVSGNHGDQTATAVNNVLQNATSRSEEEDSHGDWWKHKDGWKKKDGHGGITLDLAGNLNFSSAEARNVSITHIETDVDGGDGGLNIAAINTGIIGGHSPCPWWGDCDVDIHTGDVKVVQNANGGDVHDSGNVSVGDKSKGHRGDKPDHAPGDRPEDKPSAKPSVKPASAPTHRAPVSATAQPSGQLAYTGADVSLPLTVGLIALGAGFALTAAGRRASGTV
jgi:hypothetical protein